MRNCRRLGPGRQGFNLIEVMIAVGVVAVGVLGVFSVFLWGTKASAYGGTVAEATNYCRQVLEIIRSEGIVKKQVAQSLIGGNNGLNDAANTRRDLNEITHPTLGTLGNLPAATRYTRNIKATQLSGSPTYRNELYRLEVTIYWKERSLQNDKGSAQSERRVQMVSLVRGQ